MKRVDPDLLVRLVSGVYVHAGVKPKDARLVAEYQVGANLAGHDSHGVYLVPIYLDRIRRGK
jgi:uncharacterized oxidoreductase